MPQRKVIHVDDDEVVLRTVARFLEARGFTVVSTSNPFVAALIVAERPDALVMDVDMPLISGDRIVAIMRSHDFSTTPVIFFSGKPRARLEAIAASMPGSHVVPKDAGLEALFGKIREVVGPGSSQQGR